MSKFTRLAELGLWPRWLGAEVAAVYCQVSESTFHERVKSGAYPKGFKDGDLVQWDRHDLDEAKLAMKNQVKVPPAQAGQQSSLAEELETWNPGSSAKS